MRLDKLIEMQVAGAFKVGENSTREITTVAGMMLDREQADSYTYNIGWQGRKNIPAYLALKKTDSFVKAFRQHLTNPIFASALIGFEAIRLENTEKVAYRITIDCPKYRLTIVNGLPGIGGAFAVFNRDVSQAQAAFSGRTMKQACEYINSFV